MIIFLILILGIILRVINLNQSLWLDEAISALAARDFSYQGIIFDFLRIDNHPPVFYLLLKAWGQIFGFTDINLRFLPVILGVLLIYAVFRIVSAISGNSKTAVISALLTATSPLLIYFSQELRMYILITLLCSIQTYVYLQLIKKNRLFYWGLFSALGCLIFFSDYITVFFLPVFLVYPLVVKNFRLLRNTMLSFLPLLVLFIFWYPYFDAQLLKNKELVSIFPGWGSVVGGATFKNLIVAWMKFILGRISFEPKILYYGLTAVFSLPVIYSLYRSISEFKKNLLIWLWFLFPVIAGFLFSFLIPVFNYFRFIYVLPAMIILVSLGLQNISRKPRYLLTGLLIAGSIAGLLIYYLDPSQQRENWRQAVGFLEQNAGKEEIAVFEFFEPFAPYKWYSTGKTDAVGATNSYLADKNKTYEKLGKALKDKTGVYHFEYLRDLTDPQKFVEQKIADEGFRKGQVYNNFYNIGQITYWSR